MNGRWLTTAAMLGLLALTPRGAAARGLNVEVWTDRGDDAVYQPGEGMEIRARASADAYLLVYEIDAEGHVRLLYPYRGGSGFVEGRRTYRVPPERSNIELVVEGPVGQCYVVAIASRERFRDLPWYLRPYDMQAEQVGYQGMQDDEQGITAEGRIVGDPFVAMERIRRRVLTDPEDADAFGAGYASYYVHTEVRYPRYLCYDCHRPGRWAWWPGFDPYYTHCSVFSFRVNWSWWWGPGYWFGCVPYYYYVVRPDCPPYYRHHYLDRSYYSSWDGWRRWKNLWGERLVRYKSDPPAGYVPPARYPGRGIGREERPAPPGFMVSDVRRGREGMRPRTALGRNREAAPREGAAGGRRPGPGEGRGEGWRSPGREVLGEHGGPRRPSRDAQVWDRPARAPAGGDLRPRREAGRREDRLWHRDRREARAPERPHERGEAGPRTDRVREVMPREATPGHEPAPQVAAPRHEAPRGDRGRNERGASPGRGGSGHGGGTRVRG